MSKIFIKNCVLLSRSLILGLLLFFFIFNNNLFASGKLIDTRGKFDKGTIITSFDSSRDSLCFNNYDFVGSMGMNPFGSILGRIADRKGACQGMVGLSAAIKMKVEFRKSEKKQSEKKLNKQLKRAIRLHQNNCDVKIIIS